MEPNHVEKNGEEHLILFSLGEILDVSLLFTGRHKGGLI